MKRRKSSDPNSPEVVAAVCEHLRSMSPEEFYKFATYRTPGVEMTDMTGMFGDVPNDLDKPEVFERTVQLFMEYRKMTREQAEARVRSEIRPKPEADTETPCAA